MFTQITLLALALSSGQIVIEKTDDKAVKKQPQVSTRKDLHGDPLPKGALARLGSLRFRDPAGITAVAFSKDGKEIFVYGMPSQSISFAFWDTASGKELSRFEVEDKATVRYVRQVAVSPDGKTFGMCREGALELYERKTGKRLRAITIGKEVYNTDVISFAFSPDGKLVVAGCMEWQDDNPIRVWEVDTGKQLESFRGKGVSLNGLTFSADGKQLFSGPTGGSFTQANRSEPIPGSICIWDVGTRKLLRQIDYRNSNVAFAESGDKIALEGGRRESLSLPPAEFPGPPNQPEPKKKERPRGPFDEPGIHIVSSATGKALCLLPALNASFAFTPDGKALVSLDDKNGLRLWDAASGKESRRFSGYVPHESQLAGVTPDGKYAVVLAGNWHRLRSLRLWEIASGKEVRPYPGHQDHVTHLAFSFNGKLLASGSLDRTVHIWDVGTARSLHQLTGHKAEILAVAFSPDARMLATSSADATRLWNVETGGLIVEFDHPPGRKDGFGFGRHSHDGMALAFAADGKTLHAVGRNGMVAVWDVVGKKELRREIINEKEVAISTPPVFVRGVEAVLTANGEEWRSDGPETLNLWSLAPAKMTQVVPLRDKIDKYVHVNCSAVAASADGRFIASSQKLVTHSIRTQYMDPSLRIFERLTGSEMVRVKDVLSQAVAFSPDGSLIAADAGSASTWGNIGMFGFGSTIGLWDALTGELHGQLAGHWSSVTHIAFAPDGKTLASGSGDHTILIWETPRVTLVPAKAAPTAKELAGWWHDLSDVNGTPAHQAVANLARRPAAALALLRDKLPPAAEVDPQKVAALIKDLDSDQFARRDAADAGLADLAELAEPMLRKTLAARPSSEVQTRIEKLLAQLSPLSPRPLRIARALAVLERIGSPAAIQLIEAMARGAPEARLTRAASESLKRLGKS